MAVVTGSAKVSLDASTAMFASQISGLEAGEALKAGAMCYVKSDGKVYECLATTGTTAAAAPFGVTARQTASGEPVTLFGVGARLQYASGLSPGSRLFIDNLNAGYYNTTGTNGDNVGVAMALTSEDIMIVRADGRPAGK